MDRNIRRLRFYCSRVERVSGDESMRIIQVGVASAL